MPQRLYEHVIVVLWFVVETGNDRQMEDIVFDAEDKSLMQ